MFAFCVCLVFNAHPDVWLPEEEFDQKHVMAAKELRRLQEILDDAKKDFAKNPDLAEKLAPLIGNMLQNMDKKRARLPRERAVQRTRLLINKSSD